MVTQAEAKATANGVVELYASLTPNLMREVAKRFQDELSLSYRIQSGEMTAPKTSDRMSLECFFAILEEVSDTYTRHFQRGMNSRQILDMVIDETVPPTVEELKRLYPERYGK